jgi:hypothetical protein
MFADPAGELFDWPVIAVRDHRSDIHGHIPFHFDVKGELLPGVLCCYISYFDFSLRCDVQKPQGCGCARRICTLLIKATETRASLLKHGMLHAWEKIQRTASRSSKSRARACIAVIASEMG